jgi:hypothetical protein
MTGSRQIARRLDLLKSQLALAEELIDYLLDQSTLPLHTEDGFLLQSF